MPAAATENKELRRKIREKRCVRNTCEELFSLFGRKLNRNETKDLYEKNVREERMKKKNSTTSLNELGKQKKKLISKRKLCTIRKRNNNGMLNGLSVQLTPCTTDQHSSKVRLPIPAPPPAPPAPPSPAAEARDYRGKTGGSC